ncbi:hypothetical protein CS0771_05600 [Catellatospora sp. IY07-71]|nr:hypothetical protein CS0771_05600 [Catellatospora sp. IY07-71]
MVLFGVAAAAVAAPGGARAATAPKVDWAGSVSDDLGRVAVRIQSAVAVTAIKAHVVTLAGVEVATVEAFELHSGTALNGEWRASGRLSLAQLGNYPLTVEVWTADGGYAHAQSAFWSLRYRLRERFEGVAAAPETVDFRHRTVTISGRHLVIHPSANTPAPVAGVTIGADAYMSADGTEYPRQTAQGATGADGAFRMELTLAAGASVTVNSVVEAMDHSGVQRWVGLVQTPTRLSVEVDPGTVRAGTAVEVRGLLERQVDGVWEPLPGQVVRAHWELGSYRKPVGTGEVTTDAAGRFTTTDVPPTGVNELFAVYRGEGDSAFYLPCTTTVRDLRVQQDAVVQNFTAARTGGTMRAESWRVHGFVAYPGAEFFPADTNVWIQTSADGVSWRTLTIVRAQGPDLDSPREFTASVMLTGGRWLRAYVPGGPAFTDASAVQKLNRPLGRLSVDGTGRVPVPRR